MKYIFIIIKKEFTELLRDKRTLITMIFIPLLMFPIIMIVIGSITSKKVKQEEQKTLNVAYIDNGNQLPIIDSLKDRDDIKISLDIEKEDIDTLISKGQIDGAIVIENNFTKNLDSLKTGNIILYYKAANWGVKNRLMQVIDIYKNDMMEKRLKKLNLSRATINPVNVEIKDISSPREKISEAVGGFLPYIFILFSFMGCMHPAIDLFTNEKERGTIETILIAPINRIYILFGKMIVVTMIGLISALLSITGLAIGFQRFAQGLPPGIFGSIINLIEPGNIALMFLMLLPITIFFAGFLTFLANFAKSYKEAQALISPMTIVVVVPALVGVVPGIKLTPLTALIPITNVSLATKEIIAGTMELSNYFIVVASLIVYATIAVVLAMIWFGKERNIVK